MTRIKKYIDSIRHYKLPGTRELQRDLEALREANTAISSELDNVRHDLQRTRDEDEKLLADLRHQIRQIRSERGQAQQQVELLERSLAHAEHRQKFAESHMESLERKLEEERTRHDDNLQVTRTRLIHMQEEQRALLTQQTELTSNLSTIDARLLDSTHADKKSSEYSFKQLIIMSSVLFVTGTLLGVLSMQNLQQANDELNDVRDDLRDMRGFMRQHMDNQDALIAELSLALNRQTLSVQAGADPATLPADTSPDTEGVHPAYIPDSQDIRDMQVSLMALGYELGTSRADGKLNIKTRQAAREFADFYASHAGEPDGEFNEALIGQIIQSADNVKADSGRYGVDKATLAAIRLGSMHSGVDFSFLMELARAESNFNATAVAPGSSAVGLYQFRPDDWLELVSTYGLDYGLDRYVADAVLSGSEITPRQSIASDPAREEALALRLNPRLASLLMAESIKRNLQTMTGQTGREPARTDLYLAHLIGPDGAAAFLRAQDETPDALAAEHFPDAAAGNSLVFYRRGQQPRTLAEVYRWLDRKFNTARYEEGPPV